MRTLGLLFDACDHSSSYKVISADDKCKPLQCAESRAWSAACRQSYHERSTAAGCRRARTDHAPTPAAWRQVTSVRVAGLTAS